MSIDINQVMQSVQHRRFTFAFKQSAFHFVNLMTVATGLNAEAGLTNVTMAKLRDL